MSIYAALTGVLLTWGTGLPLCIAWRRGAKRSPRAFVAWGWVTYTCALSYVFAHVVPPASAVILGAGGAAGLSPLLYLLLRRDGVGRCRGLARSAAVSTAGGVSREAGTTATPAVSIRRR